MGSRKAQPTTALQLAEAMALRRSREAEFATDAAAEESTPVMHRHAAELHRDAAEWQRRASRSARAATHVEQAKVHEQVAERIEVENGPQ